jgi:putative ABC transport system permease protein
MNLLSEIKEGFIISWGAIRANTLRSGLTTLGVVIGILTVSLMGTAIQGIDRSFRRMIAGLGADVIYVVKNAPFDDEEWWKSRNRRDLDLSLVRAIEQQSRFAMLVVPEAYSQTTVRRADRSATGVTVVGTTDQNLFARNFTIASGRFMSASESQAGRPVCVLGADVAERFFRHESPLGQMLKVGEMRFEVVGVLAPFDKFLGLGSDNHVLIPFAQFAAQFNPRPDITVLVKVNDLEKIEDAQEEVRGILRKARGLAPGAPDDFGLVQQDLFLNTFARVGGMFALVGLFITGLSLFVGGIGIMNIMFVSVAERTREIGVRKAIGAKRRTILIQFLIESATICLIGAAIALAIAFPLVLALPKGMEASLSGTVVLVALGVALLTGVASGSLPAWRAARLDPVEALRSE